MAWKEVLPMDERRRFVLEAEQGVCSFTELCEEYGISRKTGYKWFNRYLEEQFEGLKERHCAPKKCPHKTGADMEGLIIAERKKHLDWGPKKIHTRLSKMHPELTIPAPSTIGEVIKRHALIKPRRKRVRPVRKWPGHLTKPRQPNHVWSTDFKGWFRTGDGRRCDPLTISDLYSRYVLDCRALLGQHEGVVRPAFIRVFKTFGLPKIIRVDNGSPFGSPGALGLTHLSMWWVQLGIEVEFIDPGHPEQNGVHERMHRSLKAKTICPPGANRSSQQRIFDDWRIEFNCIRPHEALGMRCPAELFEPSNRPYPKSVRDFAYPPHFEVRRVRKNGQIKLYNRARAIGRAFKNVRVGLEPISGDYWRVHAGNLVLGTLRRDGSGPLRPTVSAARNHRN